MIHPRLALVIAAVVTAGCTGSPAAVHAGIEAAEVVPPLEGWVVDEANAVIEGAKVTVQGTNATTTSGPDGHYAFDRLPLDAPLVIVAEASGHVPASKGATLRPEESLLLNFTLVAIPVKVPRIQVIEINAFLGCQANIIVEADEHPFDCGDAGGPNNQPSIDFALGPDTVGVIVEIEWTASTPAAEQLKATLETTGYGDQDEVLDEKAGKSVLRLQVNSLQAMRYYSQGGHASLTIAAGANPDEDESQAGASVALQQGVIAWVSVFYVEPPSGTYTAL